MRRWIALVAFSNLVSTGNAAPSKFVRVTGGDEAFRDLVDGYREDLTTPEARTLLARRRDVLVELAAMNCAFLMVEPDLTLFPNATRMIRHEDTREAEFLRDLLGRDTVKRKAAYVTLVTKPDFVRPILAPTFSAVAVLIESGLRSPFVRMFLTLQPRWPAAFADRLQKLAAHGTAVDRRYVVDLIRQTGKITDRQVARSFYLGWQREADLEKVITSHGRVLFGE